MEPCFIFRSFRSTPIHLCEVGRPGLVILFANPIKAVSARTCKHSRLGVWSAYWLRNDQLGESLSVLTKMANIFAEKAVGYFVSKTEESPFTSILTHTYKRTSVSLYRIAISPSDNSVDIFPVNVNTVSTDAMSPCIHKQSTSISALIM